MLPYRYEPLEYDDSVRVLVLHPSLDSSEPITCTLQHARLSDESLEYRAISYTWGSAIREQRVFLHDGARELLVGDSCYSALRHLRHSRRGQLLWIDAICIDQENLREQGHQVSVMDEVYDRAFDVTVFLGEEDAGSLVLFRELAAADESLLEFGSYKRPFPSDTIIKELDLLLQRQWFKRVWVLQEVYAKVSVTIMCGSASASQTALCELCYGYRRGVQVTKDYLPLGLRMNVLPLQDFSTPQFNLWNRIFMSREYEATDSRDKIFALKSMCGREKSEINYLIDYVPTMEHCFIEVAMFLLPVLGLRLLTAVRHPHARDMPSWIPDWSQKSPLRPAYFNNETPDTEFSQSGQRPQLRNGKKYEIRSVLGIKDKSRLQLHVTGCQYTQIVDRSQAICFDDVDDARKQMEGLYHSFINLEKFVDAERRLDDDTIVNSLGHVIYNAMSLLDGSQLHKYLARSAVSPFIGEHLIGNLEAMDFFGSLQQCRISLLQNGELAIVPASASCGDIVCILSGSDAPCLLRPDQAGTWRLVSGECYLFTDFAFPDFPGWFMCDEYIARNRERVEEFVIR